MDGLRVGLEVDSEVGRCDLIGGEGLDGEEGLDERDGPPRVTEGVEEEELGEAGDIFNTSEGGEVGFLSTADEGATVITLVGTAVGVRDGAEDGTKDGTRVGLEVGSGDT